MGRLIPNQERLQKARELVSRARGLPAAAEGAFLSLSYVASVKDLIRQARDLIKFIPFSPSADAATKQSASELLKQLEETEIELLHKK